MSRAQGWARAVATVVAVLIVDQGTKQLADSSLARGESVNVFFGLDLTNTRNDGVAFGALGGAGEAIAILIGLALLLLLGYFAVNAARAWLWLPVGLLLGGALGNLVDRARGGGVIDFIDPAFWPVFNVADIAIVFGVFALLYVIERDPAPER
jgi:signal peptidase II